MPVVVRMDGDLDIARFPELRREIATVPDTMEPVLVDLAQADMVDSVCLSELVLAKRRWERAGRRVALLVLSSNVLRVLGIADVLGILNVFTNRADAIAWLLRDETGATQAEA